MNERGRFLVSGSIIVASLFFVVMLFRIQIRDNSYVLKSESNIVQRITEQPRRGFVYDRKGQLLVYNVPVYDVSVIPNEVQNLDKTLFCQTFGISRQFFDDTWTKANDYSKLRASLFLSGITHEDFARIQEDMLLFRGFHVSVRTVRGYAHPLLAHVFGYVGEISEKRLKQDSAQVYDLGDPIGMSGLEQQYEQRLRGEKGTRFKQVDAMGKDMGDFRQGAYDEPSMPGQDIHTSIDIELQSYAEYLMEHKRGSIVALEPKTGEVLSFVSAPSYDPALLSGRNYTQYYDTLSADTLKPLFNRPLMAMYRPGSIFKIAQTLLALQAEVVDTTTVFPCQRSLIGCHPHGASENLLGAITNSCNPYFYRMMQQVVHRNASGNLFRDAHDGLEFWTRGMKNLGFGRRLGIDLPSERAGYVPDSRYYDKMYGEYRWKYKTIYSLSIGEGENLVVPLQMANFAAIIANRGHYYTPHIVRRVGEQRFKVKKHEIDIKEEHFETVAKAMRQVVLKGTGRHKAHLPDIAICGKTGSVQNQRGELEHSVFIAFAPMQKPKIALAVYVEYAGEGGRAAAAISALLIEKYLKRDQAKLLQEDYVRNFAYLPQTRKNLSP